jgi:hypothetical protein
MTDTISKAKEFYLQRRLGLGDDFEKAISIMAAFADEHSASLNAEKIELERRLAVAIEAIRTAYNYSRSWREGDAVLVILFALTAMVGK